MVCLQLQAADEYCNKIYSTDIENKVATKMTQILGAKYKKADLSKVVAESEHLTNNKQSKLVAVLCRYKSIFFDGGLGLWQTMQVKLELKLDTTPYHARPFKIPRSCKETTCKERNCLCCIGVLEKCNDSKSCAPTYHSGESRMMRTSELSISSYVAST